MKVSNLNNFFPKVRVFNYQDFSKIEKTGNGLRKKLRIEPSFLEFQFFKIASFPT